MKKIICTLCIAATVITGCSKNETKTAPREFQVTAYAAYQNSRTSISTDNSLAWNTGDNIGIYADGLQDNRSFQRMSSGGFVGGFVYTGSSLTTATYRAYSPYASHASGYTITADLPTEQNAAFDGAADFMVSAPITANYSESKQISGINFTFDASSHLFTILRFTLKDGAAGTLKSENIASLRVSSAGQTLAGTFQFDVRHPENGTSFTIPQDTITASFDSRPSLASPVTAYVVVRPTDTDKPVKLTVEVFTTGGKAVFTTAEPVTLTRSTVKVMPTITVSDTWKKSESLNAAFPDAKFLKYILDNFDDNLDGQITQNEIKGRTSIECSGLGIMSLSGIELFPDLQMLDCSKNALTSLSLTSNTSLQTLMCGNNTLTAINLTACKSLTTLDASGLIVSELDLSGCPMLSSLTLTGVSIQNISIAGCTNLASFEGINIGLKSLDCSNCTSLTSLTCYDNSAMSSLKLSGCIALSGIWVRNSGLTSLDLSGLAALSSIMCQRNSLQTVNLTGCTSLSNFYAHTNPFKELDFSQCPSLSSFTLTTCPNLTTIWLKTGQTVATKNYDNTVTTIKYKN